MKVAGPPNRRDPFPTKGSTIVGGGLVVDGEVLHLVAFPGSAHMRQVACEDDAYTLGGDYD